MTSVRELWSVLSRGQRGSALVLLGMMVIAMLLETLGIGLVVPMLGLMTQEDLTVRYPAVASLARMLGNPTHEELILIAMAVLVVVYAIKTVYIALVAWWQLRFLAEVQVDLSQRLFAGYMRQPYSFHLQRNSAQLMRNAISEVSMYNAGLTSALGLMAESLVVAGVFTLLIVIEPLGALVVVTSLAVVGWGFHRITRHPIARWGEARLEHDGLRTQHLMQGLGAIKDVKLLGREENFLAKYLVHNTGRARVERRQLTLQALPRLLLEFLVVVGLAGLVLMIIVQGKPLQALVPTLGLFAVAAFRLMPSANRIIGSIQSLRYVAAGIRVTCEEIHLLEREVVASQGPAVVLERALSLERVSFTYAGAATPALADVSLTIPRGSAVGIIGSSGAGKSTLVDIMLGLLTPTAGTVRVDRVDIRSNLRGWQDQIGYVPQSIFLTDDTLWRNIAFGLPDAAIDEASVRRAIEAAQLKEFVDELPLGADTVVGERGVRLSGGQRQRIGIARALYHDPSVIVLDEATSSLDTATERDVMETVRSLHGAKTLIIVAHRLSTVEHCDRLFRLKRGRLVDEGDTAALLARAAAPA